MQMTKYGIVVIGYKNIIGIKRLLKALSEAKYDDNNVMLLISVDYSGDSEVGNVADGFEWNYGEKKVIRYEKNLGLREHVLSCGEYLNTYDLDALIVFEDDMFPSRDFFLFSKAATEKYINDDRIAGISLYKPAYNETFMQPFYPMNYPGDVFFIQYAQSRGQVWFKHQWNQFRDWYKFNMEWDAQALDLPIDVLAWPESSWKRYHTRYCMENDKFFVYPYISHST